MPPTGQENGSERSDKLKQCRPCSIVLKRISTVQVGLNTNGRKSDPANKGRRRQPKREPGKPTVPSKPPRVEPAKPRGKPSKPRAKPSGSKPKGKPKIRIQLREPKPGKGSKKSGKSSVQKASTKHKLKKMVKRNPRKDGRSNRLKK